MKTISIFSAFIFTLAVSANAQLSNSTTDWYPGVIILENTEVVKGDISYDYSHDIVMCKIDDVIKTFTPHQVTAFKYYEESENLFHDFVTLTNYINPRYQQKAFYEVVLEGDISYVRKRNKYPAYNAKEGYLANRNKRLNQHKVCYEYFVHYENELIKSKSFKREVLPIMQNKERSLHTYMKKNQLRPYDIGDQIELVEYFNLTSDMREQTAKKISLR
ncbi:hypothetical protein OKW21_001142 [Catalinimonas alkaloidigena]|uniref:hypothetical protein n=1 Tax=Catalinimonas alkaloidigena TaxID=1075417 RepID=UPI00240595F3|nr:hypothetical protein [Catalinimonas alkaloidigena]MDF9795879.1 hypothetical protein [Catalinimonas alkaloidigena]